MTSSKSYELTLLQDENQVVLKFDIGNPLATTTCEESFRTDRPVFLRISGPEDDTEVRVRVSTDVVGYLSAQLTFSERNIQPAINDLYGDAELIIETRNAYDFEAQWRVLFAYMVPLVPPRETAQLYETLIRELEQAHLSLARDFMGGSVLRVENHQRSEFEPTRDHEILSRQFRMLSQAIAKIGGKAASGTAAQLHSHRWRPGDRVDPRALTSVLRHKDAHFRGKTPIELGRIVTRRLTPTYDLPEHRHIKAGLLALSRYAEQFRDGCERAASLVAKEEEIWGLKRPGGGTSVYEERFAPRVEKLRELEREGSALASGFRQLIREHAFLEQAGRPRVATGPSHIFTDRPGYREAYRSLREFEGQRILQKGQQAVGIRLRRLDLLYEYWSYICTVALLTEQLGPPLATDAFEVVDDVYRPELMPGQRFTWHRADGATIWAYYEPAIPPIESPIAGPHGWRASLVGAPVRPDVLVVIHEPNRWPRAIALDAKNTTRFDRRNLTQYTDYRTLVFDPISGLQPIRQMFFLHRDPRSHYSSFPGHFDGKLAAWETSIIGSIPLLPTCRDELAYVLESFLIEPKAIGPVASASPSDEQGGEFESLSEANTLRSGGELRLSSN